MDPYPIRVWVYPEQFEFEGVTLTLSNERGDIAPGDLYIAGRNSGPHLLTARTINKEDGWIGSHEPAYPFDIHECRKVLAIDGEKV